MRRKRDAAQLCPVPYAAPKGPFGRSPYPRPGPPIPAQAETACARPEPSRRWLTPWPIRAAQASVAVRSASADARGRRARLSGGTPSYPIQTAPGVAGGLGTDAQTAARCAGTAHPARPLASKAHPALRRAQAGRPAQDPGSPHPGGTEAVGHASRKPGAGGRAPPAALRAAPAPGAAPPPSASAPMLRRRARCVLS